jgi:hypothetical protein
LGITSTFTLLRWTVLLSLTCAAIGCEESSEVLGVNPEAGPSPNPDVALDSGSGCASCNGPDAATLIQCDGGVWQPFCDSVEDPVTGPRSCDGSDCRDATISVVSEGGVRDASPLLDAALVDATMPGDAAPVIICTQDAQCDGAHSLGDCVSGSCTVASCSSTYFDVDDDWNTGCEISFTGTNYDQAQASNLGSRSCADVPAFTISGVLVPSDTASHPDFAAVTGVGAAPHYYRIHADGGVCTNDYAITLTQITGTASCYRLTLITDQITDSCTVVSTSCSISGGSGSYSDDTDTFVRVDKVCSTPTHERAQLNVTGHL